MCIIMNHFEGISLRPTPSPNNITGKLICCFLFSNSRQIIAMILLTALPSENVFPILAVSLNRRLGGSLEQFWTLWTRKKPLAAAGNRTTISWLFSPWPGHCTDYTVLAVIIILYYYLVNSYTFQILMEFQFCQTCMQLRLYWTENGSHLSAYPVQFAQVKMPGIQHRQN